MSSLQQAYFFSGPVDVGMILSGPPSLMTEDGDNVEVWTMPARCEPSFNHVPVFRGTLSVTMHRSTDDISYVSLGTNCLRIEYSCINSPNTALPWSPGS